MSKQKEKSNKISIYLIKDGIEYDQILKDYVYNHVLREDKNSVTYYYPTKDNRPDWLISYFNYTQDVNISNSHAQVISIHRIVIDGVERIFAIPFGSGKYLLNDDVIEEQFGIKILLNSVSNDGFRQLVVTNYGGDHRIKNEQTPKKTNINEFGFDVYNDFVRRATAKSDEELFNNNTIMGGDLLSVSVPVTIENVDNFLILCYKRYKSNRYKENFSWLDNIREVKEKNTKQALNEKLVNVINQKEFDKVWAAVPEIIEWEKILDFRFNILKKGYDDIEIQNIIEIFNDHIVPSIDSLKSRKIFAMAIDGNEALHEWTIYNCLIAEIEHEGSAYCLNYGKWYRVDKSFVETTNNYYKSIKLSDIVFPNNNNEREDMYNEKLNNKLQDSILMDKKTVRIPGMGKSSIEVCDVLTHNNQLIHVKKNGGSSYLSHLFNQASVSGEMLLDKSFREEVNKKMGNNIFDDSFSSSNYTVVLAIITNCNYDRPKIPFFSKVSIQYAIAGLKRKGYNVEIKNIYNKIDDK